LPEAKFEHTRILKLNTFFKIEYTYVTYDKRILFSRVVCSVAFLQQRVRIASNADALYVARPFLFVRPSIIPSVG